MKSVCPSFFHVFTHEFLSRSEAETASTEPLFGSAGPGQSDDTFTSFDDKDHCHRLWGRHGIAAKFSQKRVFDDPTDHLLLTGENIFRPLTDGNIFRSLPKDAR